MELKNCTMAFGVVQATDDPDKEGKIQIVIPEYIDNSNIAKEIMPWARPFSMTSAQSFSMPQVGNKVWVIINNSNYNEFWYLPFAEPLAETNGFVKDNYENNPEVIYNKDGGGTNQARVTYDDKNGFETRIGNNVIAVRPDEQIDVSTASGTGLGVSSDKVYVGKSNKDDNWDQAVLGSKLVELIDELIQGLDNLSTICAGSWTTTHLELPLKQCIESIEEKKKYILSENVKLN